jgi:aldehyde dehydrogenase
MAAWKLAPALAAGNCAVIKPASPTPWSILKLMETIEDVLPPGLINVITGPGAGDRQGARREPADREGVVHG